LDPIDILGFVGGALATIAFFPQVWKSWKSGSTRDISLPAFSTLMVANYLWIAYGVALGSAPLIVTNALTGSMITSLVILKISNG
jgi:MtN3 and saliva related transmembrane protein